MPYRFIGFVHGTIEISPDLEYLPYILIVGQEQLIQVRIRHYDDLDVHFQGFGLHARGGEEVERIICLNFHFLGFQRSLQRRPHPGLDESVKQAQYEIAPVGLDNGTRLYFTEIRPPHTGTIDDPLDASEKITIGRK